MLNIPKGLRVTEVNIGRAKSPASAVRVKFFHGTFIVAFDLCRGHDLATLHVAILVLNAAHHCTVMYEKA